MAIKKEPAVAVQQYRFNDIAYADALKQLLLSNDNTGSVEMRYSSIELGGKLVGYVCHTHYTANVTGFVECSWNLASDYQGRGIMYAALSQLLDDWILKCGLEYVVADHFRKNSRCKRLLDRLGFATVPISIEERVANTFQMKCLQWIVRRRLDSKTWKTTRTPINNGIGIGARLPGRHSHTT